MIHLPRGWLAFRAEHGWVLIKAVSQHFEPPVCLCVARRQALGECILDTFALLHDHVTVEAQHRGATLGQESHEHLLGGHRRVLALRGSEL